LTPIYGTKKDQGAYWYIMFFIIINAVNILLAVWLYIVDERGDQALRKVAGKKSRIMSKSSLRTSIHY